MSKGKEKATKDVASLTESYAQMVLEERGPTRPAEEPFERLYEYIMIDYDIAEVHDNHTWSALRGSPETLSAILLARILGIFYDFLCCELKACSTCSEVLGMLPPNNHDINGLLRTLGTYVRAIEALSSKTNPREISLEKLLGKTEKKCLKSLVNTQQLVPSIQEGIGGEFEPEGYFAGYFLAHLKKYPDDAGLCDNHMHFAQTIVGLGNQGFVWKAAFKDVRLEESDLNIRTYKKACNGFIPVFREWIAHWTWRAASGGLAYDTATRAPEPQVAGTGPSSSTIKKTIKSVLSGETFKRSKKKKEKEKEKERN